MLIGQYIKTEEEFSRCRVMNSNIEVELKDEQVIVDSGIIQENNYPHSVVINGKNYNIQDYFFVYRPYPES